jgi:hypothetical protein
MYIPYIVYCTYILCLTYKIHYNDCSVCAQRMIPPAIQLFPPEKWSGIKRGTVGAEALHVHRNDEGNSRCWQFCDSTYCQCTLLKIQSAPRSEHLPSGFRAVKLSLFRLGW